MTKKLEKWQISFESFERTKGNTAKEKPDHHSVYCGHMNHHCVTKTEQQKVGLQATKIT